MNNTEKNYKEEDSSKTKKTDDRSFFNHADEPIESDSFTRQEDNVYGDGFDTQYLGDAGVVRNQPDKNLTKTKKDKVKETQSNSNA